MNFALWLESSLTIDSLWEHFENQHLEHHLDPEELGIVADAYEEANHPDEAGKLRWLIERNYLPRISDYTDSGTGAWSDRPDAPQYPDSDDNESYHYRQFVWSNSRVFMYGPTQNSPFLMDKKGSPRMYVVPPQLMERLAREKGAIYHRQDVGFPTLKAAYFALMKQVPF